MKEVCRKTISSPTDCAISTEVKEDCSPFAMGVGQVAKFLLFNSRSFSELSSCSILHSHSFEYALVHLSSGASSPSVLFPRFNTRNNADSKPCPLALELRHHQRSKTVHPSQNFCRWLPRPIMDLRLSTPSLTATWGMLCGSPSSQNATQVISQLRP
ncbi:hypothetical protein K458DRAFT_73455 [Lentithecium fluviatile CBS 122367]|uniref:Uncharacterized protein n=1 Tax=Lentithecium fluviatile CBS 122367 TaxID=1168545 RepID=A0A6G1IVB8_9PLEO|nr:hypothetical protein K458DRAFT_73455 [Lentithecium fluviatile CBS 122367]